MPEISSAELRRLEALSDRIVRAEDRRRSLQQQRDEARGEVKQLKADGRKANSVIRTLTVAAERADRDHEKQIAELIEENRRLSRQLSDLTKDADKIGRQAAKLAEERQVLRKDVAGLRSTTRTLSTEVKELRKKGVAAKEQLETAKEQLAAKDSPLFLTADTVGSLLHDFVDKIDIGGLEVNQGDIRLNVAFGSAGEATGFVIPSTAEDADLPLHAINLNLTKKPRPDG